jgi:hypothetical protein
VCQQVEDSARAAAEKNVHEKELKHAAKAAERAQLLSAIEEDKVSAGRLLTAHCPQHPSPAPTHDAPTQ